MRTIAHYTSRFLFTLSLILLACTQNGQFELDDGKQHSLDDFSGRWILINFWAEWCSPCLEEIPAVNQLYRNAAELNLVVIGVSYDPLETKQLHSIMSEWKIEYPVMKTVPSPILPFTLPQTLPTNYLLDPKGKVVAKLVGKQTYSSLVRAIQQAKSINL